MNDEHIVLLKEIAQSVEGLRCHVDQVNHGMGLEIEKLHLKLNRILREVCRDEQHYVSKLP